MDAHERGRRRLDLLARISAGSTAVSDEMCECLAIPLNYWLHKDGEWSEHPITGDSKVDATAFNEALCVGWVIGCPRCGSMFSAGVVRR